MNTDAAGVMLDMVISSVPARRMLRVSGVTPPDVCGGAERGADTRQLCQHPAAATSFSRDGARVANAPPGLA